MRSWRGASPAWAVPPKDAATFPGVAAAAPAPAPAVPTFVNGMAQAVFPTSSASWVNHDLWVELDVDTDGDGLKDRVHTDVSRPAETDSDGLKVPVIFEDSPYYAGSANVVNWAVDHELGVPPATRIRAPLIAGRAHTATINTIYESTWVPRGFAVVHSESPGSGSSTGCPSSGAPVETLGATAVIDWLNGRRKGYTTKAGTTEVQAYWHNGNSAMMGTSYNGTLPIAAASTGVEGLKAIVPISAISDWYDYYRANGMTRAPGGFQGEDLDVLSEYIYSRNDDPQRTICWPGIQDVAVKQDRASGNRSAFWDERNYMPGVRAGKVKAASLIAHGNGDNNVMTKNAVQYYEELKKQGVPRAFYFHQGGHGGAPPDFLLNLWFSKYLYNQDNGAENLPKSWVVRETTACPPRESTVVGAVSNTTTLTVAMRRAVPRRLHAHGPADQRQRHDHVDDARDHQHRRQRRDAGHRGRDHGGPDGGQWRGRQPRLQHRQPDAVRRVARPDDGRLRAAPRRGWRGARRARLRPGHDRQREADRRRQRRPRDDPDERGDRGLAPALRVQPADVGRAHLGHAEGLAQRRLQQGQGEPDGRPRLAARDRHAAARSSRTAGRTRRTARRITSPSR